MLLFLFLPLLGIAYCGWHVWTLVPLPRLWRALIIAFGVGCFALIFLNFGHVTDRMPLRLARLCYDFGNSSIFVMLYLVMTFLVLDLGRLTRLIPREWLHQNFYTTAAIIVGLFVVFLMGNIRYNHKSREEVHLTTTKRLSKPVRLVMMSDLHLGYHNPRKELARWVDTINGEEPDAVLIAGDIIDMSLRPLTEERMFEELRRIKAPVFACLGNHEYFAANPQALQLFYADAGICLLRDSCAVVGDLLVIGRDDRMNPHRKPLNVILRDGVVEKDFSNQQAAKVAGECYTIVLDHQPYNLEQAERAGIDFQFSGHTHRGQVWPISWITDHVYECSFGPWQRGNTHYYVSSGIGIWGGKFRIGTRSEYVVVNIEQK